MAIRLAKMKAPQNSGGLSHGGEEYAVVNGHIEVLANHVEFAKSHGFILVGDGEERLTELEEANLKGAGAGDGDTGDTGKKKGK